MNDWHDFFLAAGGAAASLTGLLFVALSVNKATIGADDGYRSLARQAVLGRMGVLSIALLALIPDQSGRSFGLELVSVSLIFLLRSGFVQVRTFVRLDKNRGRYVAGSLFFDSAFVLATAAGIWYWYRSQTTEWRLVISTFMLGAISVYNSWELVMRVDTPMPPGGKS